MSLIKENWHPYYQAFYGKDFPLSQVGEQGHKGFKEMVDLMRSDIEKQFPHVEDDETRRKMMLAGMAAMRAAGANNPAAYKSPNFAREAGYAMGSEASRKAAIDRARETVKEYSLGITDEHYAELENINVALLGAFEELYDGYVESNLEPTSAKVAAYRDLIDRYPAPDGRAYFILGWKIPQQFHIYDEEGVIDAMRNHPKFGQWRKGHSFDPSLPGYKSAMGKRDLGHKEPKFGS